MSANGALPWSPSEEGGSQDQRDQRRQRGRHWSWGGHQPFVVVVKGRYNLLLGRDWIHANGCVPSTLHQCLVQWVGDNVEVMMANEPVCIATVETSGETQDGCATCLSSKDQSDYDYINVSKNGLVPVNVKPMNVTRLNHIGDQ
jgi:hypothetical protein